MGYVISVVEQGGRYVCFLCVWHIHYVMSCRHSLLFMLFLRCGLQSVRYAYPFMLVEYISAPICIMHTLRIPFNKSILNIYL